MRSGRKDMLGHIVGEWFTCDPLDDVAGQPDAIVRIGRNIAGRKQPTWQRVSQPASEWLRRPVGRKNILGMLLEPRPMGHEAAKRDRHAAIRRRDVEIQIVVHIAIEIELALLDELHHRDPGKELRDRAGAYQRLIRGHRAPALDVGVAIAAGKQDAAILDHDRDRARDLQAGKLVRHQRIEKGREIGVRDRVHGRRRCWLSERRPRSKDSDGADEQRQPEKVPRQDVVHGAAVDPVRYRDPQAGAQRQLHSVTRGRHDGLPKLAD